MAAITRSNKTNTNFSIASWLLLALTVLGIGLAIYRLVAGLGATTNLSDHYPWGIWITIDLFLIPVAGAAFTISLLSYFLGREDYHSIIRPAVLAGFIFYSIVGILLFLDIGRWTQFYNIFVPGFINLHSFLEEISLCVTLYTIILVLEVAPVFLEKWGYTGSIRWIERSIFIIAGAGIVLSMLHQSSLGSLFLLMTHKLHPLWWTPALPLLFYLQAVYTGLGATAIAVRLIWRALKLPVDRALFRRIGQAMSINLMLYAAIKVGDWMGAGEIPLLLKPDAFGFLAWFQFLIGIVLPLAILLSKLVGHSDGPFWAGVFALIGTFIERLVVSWVGLAEPSPISYIPSFTETFITIGMIAGGILAYSMIARYFKLFPSSRHS
ncbi:MAG: polysulfide reductase NrfD [Anaerolineales bacterium]|nr:polysulfide reductase NrfD [Anaerolineales bacterium]